MDPKEGYRKARILLKQRYGRPYRIATAYVNMLAKGSPIKAEDSSALRRFSVLLTSCKNTLKEIGYLNKVENADTLKMIIDRLPYGLKLKWRNVADPITETEEREITITDVSDFVTSKARVTTHAIFGTVKKDNQAPLEERSLNPSNHPKCQALVPTWDNSWKPACLTMLIAQ